jgi:methionyl-tRNA formyltransferase
MGFPPAGVVHVPRQFGISYSAGPVENVRHVDLEGWARSQGIPERAYREKSDVVSLADEVGGELALAAGWYHMVPGSVRSRFPRGCAGIHASLLPKLRGGAPLNWAILTGARETGVSLFELGDGVDEGRLWGQRAFPVGPRATIAELLAEAERHAVELVGECIPGIAGGSLEPGDQKGTPSYCLQRRPEDGWIDWRRPARELDRLVRAVGRPYPGAFTYFEGRKLFVWAAKPASADVPLHGAPGQIGRLPGVPGPCVVTGEGALVLREVTDDRGESILAALERSVNRRFDSESPPAEGT